MDTENMIVKLSLDSIKGLSDSLGKFWEHIKEQNKDHPDREDILKIIAMAIVSATGEFTTSYHKITHAQETRELHNIIEKGQLAVKEIIKDLEKEKGKDEVKKDMESVSELLEEMKGDEAEA